jgi:S-(hydroxymethyl)mycothiol dehydrogenase
MPKAAVCVGLNEPLEIQDLELDSPHAGEVRVRMGASGVCHSDLSIQNGTLMGALPMVLGHEGAGVIEELGDGVTGLEVGDHVVVSWVPQCGECFFCKRGQGFLCEAGQTAMMTGGLLDGTTRFSRDGQPVTQMACSGTFSEQAVIPAIGAVKIPKDIPLEIGALIGCGVLTGVGAALNTANIKRGDTVAVIGCGGVGNAAVMGSRLAGARTIIAVDVDDRKLELAKGFGATHTVNSSNADAVAAIQELTDGFGADVVIDAVGRPETYQQAFAARDLAGTVVLVGVPTPDMQLTMPLIDFFSRGGALKSSWYGDCLPSRDFPMLIDLYQQGRLPLQDFVSERIGLGDVEAAFDKMHRGEVLRSVVVF